MVELEGVTRRGRLRAPSNRPLPLLFYFIEQFTTLPRYIAQTASQCLCKITPPFNTNDSPTNTFNMATETTSNDNNTAAQTTSSSARPKVKIFDASAMAQTFVSVPKTKIVSTINPQTSSGMSDANTSQSKSVPTKALLSKPPPVAHNAKPKPKAKRGGNRKATQTTPLFDEIGEDDWVSFDGEFQDVKYPGKPFKPELAWVAVTGPNGEVLYNVFSRYEDEDPEGTYRQLPRGFGITWNDLKYRNGAVKAREVEEEPKEVL